MNPKREKRLSTEYTAWKNKILINYERNPEAYTMAMIKRKARIQNEPLAYGAIVVLIIGFIWDMFTRFVFNTVQYNDQDIVASVHIALVSASVIVMIGVIVIFCILVHYNRKAQERILLEEYILAEYIEEQITIKVVNEQNNSVSTGASDICCRDYSSSTDVDLPDSTYHHEF